MQSCHFQVMSGSEVKVMVTDYQVMTCRQALNVRYLISVSDDSSLF